MPICLGIPMTMDTSNFNTTCSRSAKASWDRSDGDGDFGDFGDFGSATEAA